MLYLAVAALIVLAPVTQGAVRFNEMADTPVAYVVVTDTRGRPVGGLSAQDFRVRVGGDERAVVDVRQATDPPSVVVVVDGYTDAEALQVRKALGRVLEIIRADAPGARVGLMADEGCGAPSLQEAGTAEEFEQRAAAFVRRGDSAPLLECMTVAADVLAREPTRRRLILVLTSQRNSVVSASRADVTAAAVQRSGASLWVMQSSLPHTAFPSAVATEQVLREVSRASGGTRERRLTWLIDDNAAALTTLMLAQYAVTFTGQGHTGQRDLDITVTREGLEILAPRWTAREPQQLFRAPHPPGS